MSKIVNSFSRIAVSDSDGCEMAFVRCESLTTKIVRDIDKATKWHYPEKHNAETLCDKLNNTHALVQFEVLDYEVVETERRVKPRRQRTEE